MLCDDTALAKGNLGGHVTNKYVHYVKWQFLVEVEFPQGQKSEGFLISPDLILRKNFVTSGSCFYEILSVPTKLQARSIVICQ